MSFYNIKRPAVYLASTKVKDTYTPKEVEELLRDYATHLLTEAKDSIGSLSAGVWQTLKDISNEIKN